MSTGCLPRWRGPPGTHSRCSQSVARSCGTISAGDTEILRVDSDGFKQIYACTVLESCGVRGFDAANKRAYFVTNKGSLNLIELDLLDPATGAAAKVEGDPLGRVDITNGKVSEVDHRILFTDYEDDTVRRYFRDKDFEKDYRWLQSKLPGLEIIFGHFVADVSRLQVLLRMGFAAGRKESD